MHKEEPCWDPSRDLPAAQRVIQQSFFHQELVPFRSREAGAAHSTHAGQGDLWLCLHPSVCATPTCSEAVLTSTCLFSFAANPTWLSSPGHEHSTPFFCCLSRLPLVPAGNRLSPSLQNLTDTGQERKQSLRGKKATNHLICFSEIHAEIGHASHPQTTGVVVTTPSTKLFLLGPSTSRVWISNLQAAASCF